MPWYDGCLSSVENQRSNIVVGEMGHNAVTNKMPGRLQLRHLFVRMAITGLLAGFMSSLSARDYVDGILDLPAEQAQQRLASLEKHSQREGFPLKDLAEMGHLQRQVGNLDVAEGIYRRMAREAHDAEHEEAAAYAMRYLGLAAWEQGRLRLAEEALSGSLKGFYDSKQLHIVARTYGDMADIYRRLGDKDRAERFLKRAQKLMNGRADRTSLQRLQLYQAMRLIDHGEHKIAASQLKRLYSRYRDQERPIHALQAGVTLAGLHLKADDLKAASALLDELEPQAKTIGHGLSTARILRLRAMLAIKQQQADEAMKLLRRAIGQSRYLGEDMGIAFGYDQLGDLYWQSGDKDQALTVLKRAGQLYEDLGRTADAAEILYRLAHYRYKHGELAGAETVVLRAIALYNEINDSYGQARCLLLDADIQRRSGHPEKAVQILERALQFYYELGDVDGQHRALVEQAKAHLVVQNPIAAETVLDQSLQLEPAISDADRAESLEAIAELFVKRDRSDKARKALKEAVGLYEKVGDKSAKERTVARLQALK